MPIKFLFKNLGIRQTVLKNTFWLAAAEGISRLLKLILIIYVARILGVTEYGKFTFALAFVSLFVIFSDFSLPVITTRELSRGKEKEYPAILSLKIILSLGVLMFLLISSFFITSDRVVQRVIWILGIYILISNFSDIIYAFFRALQKMEYEGWAKILQALTVTGAGFFVILNFPSVENLSYSYLLAALVAFIFILFFLHFKIYHLNLDWNKFIWRKFLLLSWPLVLTRLFGAIYIYTAPILMGYWGQINQVGFYGAAFKIIGVILIPISLISQSFYPLLSKVLEDSREKFQKIWNYQMEAMIFLSFPMVIGGMALAPKIINLIYGPAFSSSVFAFQILIIMAGLTFLCAPLSQTLVIFNEQKKVFWITLFGGIIGLFLNFIFVPKFSFYGAAFVAVIISFFFLLLFWKVVSKSTFIKPLNFKIFLSFIGAIPCSLLMYFIISQPQIFQLNIFLSVLIGAVAYSTFFFLLKKLLFSKIISNFII